MAQHHPFTYPVPDQAPSAVRVLVRIFNRAPLSFRRQLPLWARLLGDGTPPFKFHRDWLRWSEQPSGAQRCSNCNRWYQHAATQGGTDHGICDWVRGVWRADWWCEVWTEPWTRERYQEYQER